MCESGHKCKGNKMAKELILLGVLLLYSPVESTRNLLEKIQSKTILSEAARIIEGDNLLKALLTSRSFTAFIPTNEALQAYSGIKDAKLLQYHMVNLPYLVEDLPDELSTDLPGNPHLYVARLPSGSRAFKGSENYHTFINNAKIINGNHKAETASGSKQYLHIVDQVISPTLPRTAQGNSISNDYLNPDAQTLLLKPHYYGLEDEYSVKEFEKRVTSLGLRDIFSLEGKNTFFIPVDQALTQNTKDLIDEQVIHGHVIPGNVLFTRTVEKATDEYKSMAFTDNLKVLLSLENVTSSGRDVMTYYVKSHTVAGDVAHKKGTVLARIPRGNIPVKNGVVHLIDRPLMVVASSIISYLQEQDGQLTKFNDLLHKYYQDMTHNLASSDTVFTLFAPSNKAFEMVNAERLNETKLNQDKMQKLLKMHIIRDHRLTTDEIVAHSTTEEDTMSQGRKLYFAVNNPSALLPTVSLEGGGVNATITTPNIAAKNGVIHIIDRILGIPSQTVYEKLQSDPMLSKTFQLSEQNNWNERLKTRSNASFTLFVPSNDAWDNIRRNMASAYKKLFMGSFGYHGRMILERHMIAGENLSIEDLNLLTTSSNKPNLRHTALNVTRGKIYFQARVREAFGEYSLEWNGISARVIRPDLECVNGVVHVIDKVLMAKRDVTVSGSASPAATGLATLAATFVTVAFARALHR